MTARAYTDHDAQRALDAFLGVYEGPWGLKASEEDALLAVLTALEPERFSFNSRGMLALRADDKLVALAQAMFDLSCEGANADEVVGTALAALDEAGILDLEEDATR